MIRCPGSAPLCEAAGHFSGQPGGNIKIEHDEVNYAVSEKESGFSGVMTLTKMTGSTGLQWDVLGPKWAVLGCIALH